MTRREKCDLLRRLHTDPQLLVLVNAWDVASARAVAAVPGCRAVATASHSVAAAHGYDDGEQIPLPLMIAAVARIAAAVDLPVTADLEAGYGDAGATTRQAIEAGAVGCNLEDAMGDPEVTARAVAAARDAGATAGVPLVINARTDTHLVDTGLAGAARVAEAIRRGRRYLAAGADCVFVPACTDPAEITELVAAFGPGRLSLLGVPGLAEPGELQRLGVARVSYGPYPQRWAMAALTERATQLLGGGAR